MTSTAMRSTRVPRRWFERRLAHTCTVERDTGTSQSSSGEIGTSWSATTTTQPCRYVERTERVVDPSRGLVMFHQELVLMRGTADVNVNDRLSTILDADGGTIEAGPFVISQKLERRNLDGSVHHISLLVDRVTVT